MPHLPLADLSLRIGEPGDAVCLGVLATQVFLDTYATRGIRRLVADEVRDQLSTEAVARWLADAATLIILAESAGHLIGFAQLTRAAAPPHATVADAVELNRLYVQEPFTGRGVGRRLVRRAEDWAVTQRAPLLWLTAWVGNARALAFYPSQGYADVGSTMFDFRGEQFENRVFAKALGPH